MEKGLELSARPRLAESGEPGQEREAKGRKRMGSLMRMVPLNGFRAKREWQPAPLYESVG